MSAPGLTVAGFRALSSGLLVPAAADARRERQVWTRDEWRLLDRATKLANSRGLSLLLECRTAGCGGELLTRGVAADGTPILRCPHADRVVLPNASPGTLRDGRIKV